MARRAIWVPWEEQPTFAATVNWANPLARGLTRLIYPLPGGMFDAVTQQFLSENGSPTGLTQVGTPEGIGGRNTVESSYWTFPVTTGETSQSLSAGWIGSIQGGSVPTVFRDNTGTPGEGTIYFVQASGWDVRSGGTDHAAGGTFASNTLYRAVATSSSTSTRVYVQGQGRVVTGGGAGTFPIISPWYLHRNGSTASGGLITTCLFALWDRPIEEEESYEWLERPFQLFSPYAVWSRHGAAGTALKVYTGSAWETKPLKWTDLGLDWYEKPLKRWTGSAWQ